MRSKDTILGTHRNSSNWPEDRERLFLEVAIDARDMLSCIDDRLEQLVEVMKGGDKKDNIVYQITKFQLEGDKHD